MPRYSDEIIEEVRSRSDIVDVIGQYVSLQKKGSTYFGLCPFHNEKTGSFSVTPSKQMYYCFGCHAGGNVFTFIQQYENMTFSESLQYLADRAGVQLPQREMTASEKREQDRKSQLFEIEKDAAGYFYKLLRSERGKRALDYFTKRELSPETMQKFGLGYSDMYSDDLYKYLKSKGYSDDLLKDSGLVTLNEAKGFHDKFWNRAMFPIMNENGKVVAFGGRVMGEGEPKYLNSPETPIFNKSRTMYGLYLARKSKREQLILCEGYMDVIALHQAGFDNAVASLGTALTTGHANMLKRYTKAVYMSYDSDGAGQNAIMRAIPILKEVGISCKIIDMTPYKDPDEFMKALGPEEYEKRIRDAMNSFIYQVMMTQKNYDMTDPESKSAFQKEVARMIVTEFDNDIERGNYTESVAMKFNIPLEALKGYIIELGRQGGIVSSAPKQERSFEDRNQKRPKDDGFKKSQRLLLTWIVEDPRVFPAIKDYIEPSDFEEGVYTKVATEIFAQYQASGSFSPEKIVDLFTDDEDQRIVTEMFFTSVGEIASATDMQKALKETLIRIKRHSLEAGGGTLASTIQARQTLQRLERIEIRL